MTEPATIEATAAPAFDPRVEVACVVCGGPFRAVRPEAKCCSAKCRKALERKMAREGRVASQKVAAAAVGPIPAAEGGLPAKGDLGLSPVMMQRLIARSQARAGVGIDPALRKITTAQILERIDDKIARAFDWLDDAAMAMSSAKDLSVMTGVLIDKRAMLKGETAEAPSAAVRAKLVELLPALQAELSRRMDAAKVIEGAAVPAKAEEAQR